MLDESLISANLGNDHGYIIKEYYLHWDETFWGSPKQSHERLCSKWYHTIVESRSSNMVSELCPKNLAMSIKFSNVEQRTSNVEQRTPKERSQGSSKA